MERDKVIELVQQFAMSSKFHHQYIMSGEYKKTNIHAKKIAKIFGKIRAAGENAREELASLMHDDDPAVASMAALYSLRYKTDEALLTLERIAKLPGIVGFEARQAIQRWKEGDWHLE